MKILNNPKIQKMNYRASLFGFDIIKFLVSIKPLIKFRNDLRAFKLLLESDGFTNKNDLRIEILPYLHDFGDQAGVFGGHYFYQDLITAQLIFKSNPILHVDIGSRIDGLITHLCTFRKVKVIDIRPLESPLDNLEFIQADAMNLQVFEDNSIESISSLHAIEHFGLGRYGDPLNPKGHIQALQEIQRVLKPGGIFYLSFPAGIPKIIFNDKRIVDPSLPEKVMDQCDLLSFIAIPGVGKPIYGMNPRYILNNDGFCGLWIFKKKD